MVDIGPGTREQDYQQSVQGKIVLTPSDSALAVDRTIYEHGALGIISCWTSLAWDRLTHLPGDYPTLVGWRHLPDPINRLHGTLAFMISPQCAHELQAMLRSGVPISIRASVDAKLGHGSLGVVSGVIRETQFPSGNCTGGGGHARCDRRDGRGKTRSLNSWMAVTLGW